jgi:hypothetical protein
MQAPSFSKLLHQVTIHKLVISLSSLLEGLPYDGNEELHGDRAHYNRIGKEEDFGGKFGTAAQRLI